MFRNLNARYQTKIIVKNMTLLHNSPSSGTEISIYIQCFYVAIENRRILTSTI